MKPARYPITAYQGRTFEKLMTWKIDNTPVDLSGYDARMQVRSVPTAAGTILELTVANSRVELGGVAGTIRLIVDAEDMLTVGGGFYEYDLEVESAAGVVTPLLVGPFTVVSEVTRTEVAP